MICGGGVGCVDFDALSLKNPHSSRMSVAIYRSCYHNFLDKSSRNSVLGAIVSAVGACPFAASALPEYEHATRPAGAVRIFPRTRR
jgi:hypothetical protein